MQLKRLDGWQRWWKEGVNNIWLNLSLWFVVNYCRSKTKIKNNFLVNYIILYYDSKKLYATNVLLSNYIVGIQSIFLVYH